MDKSRLSHGGVGTTKGPQGLDAVDMPQPTKPIERRLLNIQEVAGYTGLSVYTLYTMVSQRRIPYVKVGRLTKFDVHLLDDWLKQHTVMPMPSKKAGGTATRKDIP